VPGSGGYATEQASPPEIGITATDLRGGSTMAGGRAFKSNVRERREAERRMKAMEKRRKKEEKKRRESEGPGPAPERGGANPVLAK
jgi:hypothetical protein